MFAAIDACLYDGAVAADADIAAECADWQRVHPHLRAVGVACAPSTSRAPPPPPVTIDTEPLVDMPRRPDTREHADTHAGHAVEAPVTSAAATAAAASPHRRLSTPMTQAAAARRRRRRSLSWSSSDTGDIVLLSVEERVDVMKQLTASMLVHFTDHVLPTSRHSASTIQATTTSLRRTQSLP